MGCVRVCRIHHRLVLSEAEGRVEWIPRFASLTRDDIRGRVGEHPPERRRGDRYLAWGVSPRSQVVSNPISPQRGRQYLAWGVSPRRTNVNY